MYREGRKTIHIYKYNLYANYYFICAYMHELLQWEVFVPSLLFKKWYLAVKSDTVAWLRFHPRYPDLGGQGRRESQCSLENLPGSKIILNTSNSLPSQ